MGRRMPHTSKSCKELFGCTGRNSGICTHANALDAQRKIFRALANPSLAERFGFGRYVGRLKRSVLPHCAHPEQLKAALERTKTK